MPFRVAMYALILSCCMLSLLAEDAKGKNEELAKQIAELKEERDQAAMQAEIVGRYADHFLTVDWMSYKRELEIQSALQQQVKLLDTEIEALQKEQAKISKSSTGEKKQ